METNSVENARKDLYLLLNRNYPKSYALRFVGDHYNLKNEDRYLLSRMVFPKEYIMETRKKKASLKEIKGSNLFIDGYNVIITTESILMGKAFRSMDGLMRDTRNVSNKFRVTKNTLEAVGLIFDVLERYPPKGTIFYLDKMMRQSGRLSENIRISLKERNLEGDSDTVENVDYTLKNKGGIIATNDSAIIIQVNRIIDLPSKVKTSRES